MAEFVSSPLPSPAGTTGLYDTVQRNSLANAAAQQDQTNAAQIRNMAPALAAGDPNALATAATLGVPGYTAVAGIAAGRTSNQQATKFNLQSLGQLGLALTGMDPEHQEHAYALIAPQLKAIGLNVPDQYPGAEAIQSFSRMAIDPTETFRAINSLPSTDPRGAWFGAGGPGGPGGPPCPAHRPLPVRPPSPAVAQPARTMLP